MSDVRGHAARLLALAAAAPQAATANSAPTPVLARTYELPAEVRDGEGRESSLLRYAGYLRSQQVRQDDIEAACLEFNQTRIKPPLEDAVVLDRARRYELPSETPGNSNVETIETLNERFFVAPVGGGGAVHWEVRADVDTSQLTASPIQGSAFSLTLKNRRAEVVLPDGSCCKVPASKFFDEHPRRREYRGGVTFAPAQSVPLGVFNLWSGFAVQPVPGDVNPFLGLAASLVPDEAQRTYLINWMAWAVQHPGKRPDIAVVLKGGRGIGKGSLVRPILGIFGIHGRHVTQTRHITGNFNAHLAQSAFVFADEAFWAGNASDVGSLKALITEPTLQIERKGFDVVTGKNCLKVIFASNEDWVIPAGSDERRFAVMDCGEKLKGDYEFFGAYNAWLENGGAGQMLSYLQSIDLRGWQPRQFIHTAALDKQKVESLGPVESYVYSCLVEGTSLDDRTANWREEVVRTQVYDQVRAAARTGDRNYAKLSDARIAVRMRNLLGAETGPQLRVSNGRARSWILPPLEVARKRAAEALGIRHPDWSA